MEGKTFFIKDNVSRNDNLSRLEGVKAQNDCVEFYKGLACGRVETGS